MNTLNISNYTNGSLGQVDYGWNTLKKIDANNVKRVVLAIQADAQLLLTEDRNKDRNNKNISKAATDNNLDTYDLALSGGNLKNNPGKIRPLIQQIESDGQALLVEDRSRFATHANPVDLGLFDAIDTYNNISHLH